MDGVDPRLAAIKTSLYRVATRAVILKDDKLLLVKEFDDDCWSTPGGGVDYGEAPLEALARELQEETGLEPDGYVVEEHPILIAQSVKDGIPRLNIYYHVTLTSGEIRKTKDIEFYDWHTSEEFVKAIDPTATDDARYIVGRILN